MFKYYVLEYYSKHVSRKEILIYKISSIIFNFLIQKPISNKLRTHTHALVRQKLWKTFIIYWSMCRKMCQKRKLYCATASYNRIVNLMNVNLFANAKTTHVQLKTFLTPSGSAYTRTNSIVCQTQVLCSH